MHTHLLKGADRVGGWRNHFKRTERWQRRAAIALEDMPYTKFHDALDFALAYFVWAHSLREWLLKDGVVTRQELDCRLEEEDTWPIVKDLANRSRHFVIDRSPTDAEWSMSQEYSSFSARFEGRERVHANLYYGGQKHRLIGVVASSGAMWRRVLVAVGMDVDSITN
ncbi:MAG: hypothetical protein F4Y68_04045 [Boseongicola sp. SB0665_bin_10]|nr:hypothetical protein [Boseongicola sp. SB0665_bin_10]